MKYNNCFVTYVKLGDSRRKFFQAGTRDRLLKIVKVYIRGLLRTKGATLPVELLLPISQYKKRSHGNTEVVSFKAIDVQELHF